MMNLSAKMKFIMFLPILCVIIMLSIFISIKSDIFAFTSNEKSFDLVSSENENYISNKSPLVQTEFVPLPLGTVKADGWLLKMLDFQRDGFTGDAEELYSELGINSAWLGGNVQASDWERPTYYVKGLIPLAYTLDDQNLINKAQKWIEWSINSQRNDGYFGPNTNDDWWARMPMLYAMKDYYEATNDSRVINFLAKYFNHESNTLPTKPLSEWGKSRAGDNIDVVFWLFNRTGDSFLLDLADLLKKQSYDWAEVYFKKF